MPPNVTVGVKFVFFRRFEIHHGTTEAKGRRKAVLPAAGVAAFA